MKKLNYPICCRQSINILYALALLTIIFLLQEASKDSRRKAADESFDENNDSSSSRSYLERSYYQLTRQISLAQASAAGCADDPVKKPKCRLISGNWAPNVGLGNQMFFYASLMGIAKRTDKQPYFPPNRPFLPFDFFDLGPVRTQNFALKNVEILREETSGRFLENVTRIPCDKNALLDGYYQSWKYFRDIAADIRHAFHRFLPDVQYKCQQTIHDSLYSLNLRRSNVQLVAAHMRRGDFTWNSTREYGFMPAKGSFLRSAIAHYKAKHRENALQNRSKTNQRTTNKQQAKMGERKNGRFHHSVRRKQLVFLVIGNDYEWNKENAPKDGNVIVLKPDSAGVDMCILANCDHAIVSTGSFGWWGGFLSNGYTVYQKEFARPNSTLYERINPNDYFLPHWIPL